jgi:asparagine synthase (glutamine-hydrolysing)
MCGIAGWVAEQGHRPEPGTIARMLQAIAHRGPDDHGVWSAESAPGGDASLQVVLGHQRLAIIDPQGARQPMSDPQSGLALTFNGEIYNFRSLRDQLRTLGHRFSRDSDTEVLLRACEQWGEQVVHRLRGMFAFAVWDARRQKLYLARDRFGEKPLFLHQARGALYFASEIKALLRVPGADFEVDRGAVCDYLAYRYVPGPKTLFSGVRKLPPGSYAVWERGSLSVHRYWHAPDRAPRSGSEANGDAVAAFLARLEEAVELQMVSDVPFGAFLSGGLDSSTVVALMSRHSTQVNTFSVGFGDQRYSELEYAAEVARHFGTFHRELVVSHRDIIAQLPALVGYRDAPVSEPSDIPIYMLSREAARSVKMVLTGEGSDELLGGYPKHVAERLAGSYRLLPPPLRHRLIEPLARALPYSYRRAKTAVANLNIENREERYIRWFGALNFSERGRLSRLRANGRRSSRARPSIPSRVTARCATSFTSTRRAGCPTTCWSAATA